MSKHTEKELARARRVRERKLARLTAIVQACTCAWPLVTYRNGSGHDSNCPAHALYAKFREEDVDARAELDDRR